MVTMSIVLPGIANATAVALVRHENGTTLRGVGHGLQRRNCNSVFTVFFPLAQERHWAFQRGDTETSNNRLSPLSRNKHLTLLKSQDCRSCSSKILSLFLGLLPLTLTGCQWHQHRPALLNRSATGAVPYENVCILIHNELWVQVGATTML